MLEHANPTLIGRDEPKRGFRGKLEIFCKLFVPVSYRNHPFDG